MVGTGKVEMKIRQQLNEVVCDVPFVLPIVHVVTQAACSIVDFDVHQVGEFVESSPLEFVLMDPWLPCGMGF